MLAIILITWFGLSNPLSKSQTDTNPEAQAVTQWLTDSGVKLYGAFWCPACNAQKELFGTSAKDLPYVECSTPNRSGQLAVCEADQADILRYPTWEFADGTRYEGVLTIDELKERSGYQEPIIGVKLDE